MATHNEVPDPHVLQTLSRELSAELANVPHMSMLSGVDSIELVSRRLPACSAVSAYCTHHATETAASTDEHSTHRSLRNLSRTVLRVASPVQVSHWVKY